MGKLEEIRAKLLASENKKEQQSKSLQDSLTYPHWNINEGEAATLRFLPDGDSTNTFFWRERQQIELTFPGVLGQDENREVKLRVPCMEMWDGENCPIINETRAWWQDPSLEDLARKYWKKRSYFMQGFVINSPFAEENPPENPIRKFIMSPQIFNIIKASLTDEEELTSFPTDYENGVNFIVNKTMKGKFADYTTSKFSRRESDLTEEQLAAIEEHGLFNLGDWLPKKPTPEEVTVIHELFQASVNGELYDVGRWGQFYRPYGVQVESTNTTVTFSEPVASPKPVAEPVQKQEETVSDSGEETGSSSAADILAKIRARSAAE